MSAVSPTPPVLPPRGTSSLRVRTGLLFAVFSAAMAVALTLLLGELGKRDSERQVQTTLQNSASELAWSLQIGLYERSLELRALARVLQPHLNDGRSDYERELMLPFQQANQRYALLAIASLDGIIQVASDPRLEGASVGGERFFQFGRQGHFLGTVQPAAIFVEHGTHDAENAPLVLDLATPILDEQSRPVGVLCAYIAWDWVQRRYDSLARPLLNNRNAEILVLDRDGQILLAPPGAEIEGQRFDPDELVDPSRQTESFLFGIARAPMQEETDPEWTVLIRKPLAAALEPVRRMQRHIFLGGLIGAALAGGAGWLVSGFVTRPIGQLARAARQVAEGPANSILLPAASRPDEIGALNAALRFLLETRERQAQELRQSFRQFTTIFENASVGIAQVSLSGHWLRVNHTMSEITGYSPSELRALTFQEITHPDDLDRDSRFVEQLIADEIPSYTMEKRYLRKDGATVWVTLYVSLVRDDAHEPEYFVSVVADITARKMAEAELRQSEERFRSLIEHAADAIFIADLNGVCLDVNTAACRMLQHDPVDLIGRSITDLVPPAMLPELQSAREWLVTHGDARVAEWEFQRKDGTSIPVEVSTRVLPDRRWLTFARDITERRQVAEQLRTAKDTAEAANRAKDHFLAALSHELRTPLSPVLMLASENEHSETVPPALREDFAAIRKNIALEARLIDDLLDLTRITRGKLKLEIRALDLHEVLRQAFNLVCPDLEAKQLVVTLDLSAPEHVVKGDPVRLQQVFWNIIINAVKFTPAGGTITIRSRAGANGTVQVEIRDSGLGITPEEMPRIFYAFSQGEHAASPHRFGGLGLGLSIARLLMEMHSGRIWAESAGINQGAAFHIELPLATTNEAITAAPPPPELNLETGRRILLVEDHAPTRATLIRLLQRHGHEVQAAGSIATAKALAATETFDLVVSDLGLPDGSGHELMQELSATYGLVGIALSGYGMEEDVQRSNASGFLCHLIKPVEMSALDEAIASVPRPRRRESNPAATN